MKQKIVGLLAIIAILGVVPLVWYFLPTASNQGYAPDQPIPFSHRLHVTENKIDCYYCHSQSERSHHAGIPELGICMNCHMVVKTDSPYIQKITEAYNNKEAFQWVRVHELPDFTYFSHRKHIAAGVACETCHGNVATMDKIHQDKPLTMGWCMECHLGITTPKEVLEKNERHKTDPQGLVAPIHCNTCHK